jgi:hypothetical protein
MDHPPRRLIQLHAFQVVRPSQGQNFGFGPALFLVNQLEEQLSTLRIHWEAAKFMGRFTMKNWGFTWISHQEKYIIRIYLYTYENLT